jgi:AhpD family alkylhydroperoxidase
MSADPTLDVAAPDLLGTAVLLDQMLSPRVTLAMADAELVFLRASVINGCGRCVRTHARRAEKLGISADQLQNLLDPDAAHKAFDERTRAALLFVDALSRSPGELDTDVIGSALDAWGQADTASLALVTAVAAAINRLVVIGSRLRQDRAALGLGFSSSP